MRWKGLLGVTLMIGPSLGCGVMRAHRSQRVESVQKQTLNTWTRTRRIRTPGLHVTGVDARFDRLRIQTSKAAVCVEEEFRRQRVTTTTNDGFVDSKGEPLSLSGWGAAEILAGIVAAVVTPVCVSTSLCSDDPDEEPAGDFKAGLIVGGVIGGAFAGAGIVDLVASSAAEGKDTQVELRTEKTKSNRYFCDAEPSGLSTAEVRLGGETKEFEVSEEGVIVIERDDLATLAHTDPIEVIVAGKTLPVPLTASDKADLFAAEVVAPLHQGEVTNDPTNEPTAGTKVGSLVLRVFPVQFRSATHLEEHGPALRDVIAARFGRAGIAIAPTVTTLARLNRALADSYKPCYDDRCQMEPGNARPPTMAFVTSVSVLSNDCSVAVSVHDVETGTSITGAQATCECTASHLASAVADLADEVAAHVSARTSPSPTQTP